MKVYIEENRDRSLKDQGWTLSRTAVALGGFDAIHIGHQAIIRDVVDYARNHGCTSVVYLFRNRPRTALGDSPEPPVCSFSQRLALLKELGVDAVVAEWFLPAYRRVSPRQFVTAYLRDWLGAVYLAAGFNYRFGSGGKGDAALLRQLGGEAGIAVREMPCVALDGEAVSSTRIRNLIRAGNVQEAARCLGRPFALSGTVVHGNRLGRELGFPTANLALPEVGLLPEAGLLPGYGVYISKTLAGGRWYPSITNVGNKPTVARDVPCIETHLLDFAGNLYGQEIQVAFCQYIRGISKFPDLAALRARLEQDKALARTYFQKTT